jgi:uncharacterized damage-inducible protein DinB
MNARDLFGHWDVVRRGLFGALDKLADEGLAFVPREGLWSPGIIACHIANAEDSWFRVAMASGKLSEWPAGRYRDGDYASVAALKELLAGVHARTDAWLETLDEAALNEIIELPWGSRVPRRWIVWHVLEHEIHHRGEIYLMLGLLGQEAPDV